MQPHGQCVRVLAWWPTGVFRAKWVGRGTVRAGQAILGNPGRAGGVAWRSESSCGPVLQPVSALVPVGPVPPQGPPWPHKSGGEIIHDRSAGLVAGPEGVGPPTRSESFASTFSSEVMRDAFAQQRRSLERELHPADPAGGISGTAPIPSDSREIREAFARWRWAVMAELGDGQEAGIALARLALPRGFPWVGSSEVDSHPGILGLRPSRLRRYFDWLNSGDPAADWGIVLWAERFSDRERLDALSRIRGRTKGPPIYPKRWAANEDRLVAALDELNESVVVLAISPAWAAVDEVVKNQSPMDVILDAKRSLKKFHSTLSRLLCEDLLGGDWRRNEQKRTNLSDDEVRRLHALIPSIDLTQEERALWDARRESGNWKDAGEILGLADANLKLQTKHLLAKLLPLRPIHRPRATVPQHDLAAEVSAKATMDAVLAGIVLTPAEQALLDAYREAGDWKEAGQILGLKDANLRQRKARLIAKLEPLRDELRSS